MRFLVDEQLPPALAGWLRQRGQEAFHVQDVGLLGQSDGWIARTAADLYAVVVTKDEDFAQLAPRLGVARVLWLRIGNVSNGMLMVRLSADWAGISAG